MAGLGDDDLLVNGVIRDPGGPAIPNGTVQEFYNTILDNFFITADPAEQVAVGSGGAGPGWTVTGDSFKSGGAAQVCRFYGSQFPGPNSHFYTIDPAECQALKTIQAATPGNQPRWNFESLDFMSTAPNASGNCAAGLVPVYRAYNNGFAQGKDSNHRITTTLSSYQVQLAKGWKGEGVVMAGRGGEAGASWGSGAAGLARGLERPQPCPHWSAPGAGEFQRLPGNSNHRITTTRRPTGATARAEARSSASPFAIGRLSAFAIGAVALQNVAPVTVTLAFWSFEGSLALVLLTLGLGALIAGLVSSPAMIRRQWSGARLGRKVADLEKKLAEQTRRNEELAGQAPARPPSVEWQYGAGGGSGESLYPGQRDPGSGGRDER
ncbi:MAG: LapA family protein [Betaproteobacteria bacterium]|nr:LapA family protein [Betaproteobacteria bacterium]